MLQIMTELFDPENACGAEAMRNLAGSFIKEGLSTQLKDFFIASENEKFEGYADGLSLISAVLKIDSYYGLKLLDETNIIGWSTDRLKDTDEDEAKSSESAKYEFAEFLAEIFILEPKTILKFSFKDIEMFLIELSALQTKIPKPSSDEEGYYKDIFDIFISSIKFPWVNQGFLNNEGIDLFIMLLSLKEQETWVKKDVLKVLSESTKGYGGISKDACISIVESGGIKPIFFFLKKVSYILHILALFSSSLLTHTYRNHHSLGRSYLYFHLCFNGLN